MGLFGGVVVGLISTATEVSTEFKSPLTTSCGRCSQITPRQTEGQSEWVHRRPKTEFFLPPGLWPEIIEF